MLTITLSAQHGAAFYAHLHEQERQQAYLYAYAGLEIISRRVERGTAHYRRWDGRLLQSMDEVERALEARELAGQ